jgi:hypothetical protein
LSAADWGHLASWNGLLATVASELQQPSVVHEDPSATWESLLSRMAISAHNRNGQTLPVNETEAIALETLAKKLERLPYPTETLASLGHALSQYRDVVSLNIDSTLHGALSSADATLTRPEVAHDLRRLRPSALWQTRLRSGRLWQPHGNIREPDTVVLGVRAYARSLDKLQESWNFAKTVEKKWNAKPAAGNWTPELAERWWAVRRGIEPFEPPGDAGSLRLTWLDLFLGSDLIFIGTGLDRAETDLWWALHMRQRNLARVPPRQRPGTFALFEKALCPSHLTSSPAGVMPVIFQSWKEAWDMILPPATRRTSGRLPGPVA